jgi:hypothetical protein
MFCAITTSGWPRQRGSKFDTYGPMGSLSCKTLLIDFNGFKTTIQFDNTIDHRMCHI